MCRKLSRILTSEAVNLKQFLRIEVGHAPTYLNFDIFMNILKMTAKKGTPYLSMVFSPIQQKMHMY